MSIQIGLIEFDLHDGIVVVPTWSARSYVHPGVPHVGVALQPPTGDPFTLRCTRLVDGDDFEFAQFEQIDQVGKQQTIVTPQVDYSLTPYQIAFFALDVKITSARKIAFAMGHRSGVNFQFSPAAEIVSDWTLVAVPNA